MVSLVTPPMACKGESGFRSAAGDRSLGLRGELASASAVDDSYMAESELFGNSSSPRGRGIDPVLSVLTWGLLQRWLKAASL